MSSKKRRGFTIRNSECRKSPEECLAEHQRSRAQIGERKSGLVKDRLIGQLGSGAYGELKRKLDAAVKDS